MKVLLKPSGRKTLLPEEDDFFWTLPFSVPNIDGSDLWYTSFLNFGLHFSSKSFLNVSRLNCSE